MCRGDWFDPDAALSGGDRLGLWGFDLAVTQLLQTEVAESQLGVVNGIQGALQSFFGFGEFLLGVSVLLYYLSSAWCGYTLSPVIP